MLVNAYRANNSLQAVAPADALTAAAAWMAGAMAAKNYIGPVSSDGRSPTQRMSAFGDPATSMDRSENLGAGYGTAGAVLAGWQASAPHNAVLLNPNYNAVGIGLVYSPGSPYEWYWAADFGGPGRTVRLVIPPPPPQPQPVAERGAGTSRGSPSHPSEETIDPEADARSARTAFIDGQGPRRIAHLFAVLRRMGAI